MAYRKTERVLARLAERRDAIVAAALNLAREQGMAAVQVAEVAAGATVGIGTVYRFFPAKTDLVAGLVETAAEREVAAMAAAAEAAEDPVAALAAAIGVFASRALADKRLAYAMLAEPVAPDLDESRGRLRGAIVAEIEKRVEGAMRARLVPAQDGRLAAGALFGLVTEGVIGPLATRKPAQPTVAAAVAMALHALRAGEILIDGAIEALPQHIAKPGTFGA